MKDYCKVFCITRQAYYKKSQNETGQLNKELIVLRKVHKVRSLQPMVGCIKIKKMLYDDEALFIGRDHLFDLMFRNGLLIRKKRPGYKTTDSRHRFKKHKNKIKNLLINKAEQVFVSDITYIRVDRFFMYLFLVTDIYSKKIMGYKLGDTLETKHAIDALRSTEKNRLYKEQKVYHHSDCGTQYCSNSYIKALGKYGFEISMTEENHCYENSIAERVNGILKQEFGLGEALESPQAARKVIRKSIKIYNEKRLHLSCDLLTPNKAHMKGEGLKKLWKKRVFPLADSSRPPGSLHQPMENISKVI